MYSRYSDRRDTPIRVPENYGGSAFAKSADGEAARYIEVAKPTPPEWTPPPAPPPRVPPETQEPCPPPLPQKPRADALSAGGLDFDQLLILGLILLLWGNERDGDVILWLALLLLG